VLPIELVRPRPYRELAVSCRPLSEEEQTVLLELRTAPASLEALADRLAIPAATVADATRRLLGDGFLFGDPARHLEVSGSGLFHLDPDPRGGLLE
jgi:hypothetical protein